MLTAWHQWRFVINGLTPDALPMLRLSEYMVDLARLLGVYDHVRFGTVNEGSTEIVHRIESVVEPMVRERLLSLGSDEGTNDANRAFAALNKGNYIE